jgi:membrane-bound metal-dependent hydrolase YbcI (DUF457 family)
MTVTISTFALLMIILVIHTILEHLTNWVFRLLWNPSDGDYAMLLIVTLLLTFARWVITIGLINSLLS